MTTMRKLVLKMSMSIDGFVCGPNREMDWHAKTRSAGGASWVEKTLSQAGVHIMGSRTFRDMISYWPTSPLPMAVHMNELPKVVFSKSGKIDISHVTSATQSLTEVAQKNLSTWTTAPVAIDLVSEIKKLKDQDGNYILAHGGATFVQSLIKHNLIDEYRLVIHPVILGKGMPIFNLADQLYLKLESSTHLDGGVVANVYTQQ